MNEVGVRSFFAVRPVGVRNAVKMYFGYGLALVARLVRPTRFRSVGRHIPGRRWLTISVAGSLFRARPRTNDIDLLAPGYELGVTEWLQPNRGEVVFDVGAHIGRYTIRAASRGARVIAIEPDPSNFSLLEDNIALNELHGVRALRVALDNRPGTARLYLASPENTGTSSLSPDWSRWFHEPKGRASVQVECQTLDSVAESMNVGVVDWLKIDVEGLEVRVLEGARLTLSKTRNLILEVAAGNEDACSMHLEGLGFVRKATIEGHPASTWLLGRNA